MEQGKPYRLHRLALKEVEGADDWYRRRSLDASAGFIAAVCDALDAISDAPHRWPQYLYGTRRFVLERFPFSVVYLDDPEVINVVAVAHSKRKPGYWKRRI